MACENRKRPFRELALIAMVSLVLFATLNVAANYACKFVLRHSAFRFSRLSDGTITTDLLVVGNSRGVNLLTATEARHTMSTFNLSYNGLGSSTILALVRDFFEKGNKAREVAIEVSGLNADTPNCETKPYWGTLVSLEHANMQRCRDDVREVSFLPLTRFNTELFLRVAYYAALHRDSDQDWANNYVMSPMQCRAVMTVGAPDLRGFIPRNVEVVRRQLSDFQHWMQRNAPHTKILYVLAPLLTTPATARDVAAVRASYSRLLGGYDYLDLGEALVGDCAVFADTIHLNSSGRAKIAARIFHFVQQVGAGRGGEAH